MVNQTRCLFTICGSLSASAYIWNQRKYRQNPSWRDVRVPRLCAEEQERPKVLIIGAGLTGCLTSYLLRKKLGDEIDLHVVERLSKTVLLSLNL